jgi:hypothetical protein
MVVVISGLLGQRIIGCHGKSSPVIGGHNNQFFAQKYVMTLRNT